jgi:TRAP-type mannitol/chloroaromatic compound transport system permease small subunit
MKNFGGVLGVGVLLMIVLSFTSVAIHFFFNEVFIVVQELILYLHSMVFMLGIVYAYHYDKHVRIDIFYQTFSHAKKNKVNQIGTLLLLIPFFAFLFYSSYSYVMTAWLKLEVSAEPGGLPFVYGLKSLLLILPVLMVAVSIPKNFKVK